MCDLVEAKDLAVGLVHFFSERVIERVLYVDISDRDGLGKKSFAIMGRIHASELCEVKYGCISFGDSLIVSTALEQIVAPFIVWP